ncbi:MAG: acyltransferase [Nitrosomonas sp.]|uniref:acyltransferase family protein n=1 Tax=Nitrosomonas sp. TaxID=42353 RepID=UPI0025FAEFE4|nr:acyltransferase [Nitrosomonas sp.]MBY0473526.1 acyltransferase [Nitrosomonas sp.]
MSDLRVDSNIRFSNLDKLRAFAAISVVVYHVIEHTGWSSFPVTGPNLWWRTGWLGVDLFFVISGFVIYFSAFSLGKSYGSAWKSVYASHRFFRIAPLYFFTCIIFVFLIQPQILFTPVSNISFQFISHLLFFHNFFPSTQGAINGVNWSIGVEMQFYLLILIFWDWIKRASPLKILLVFSAIACMWKIAAFYMLHSAGAHKLWFATAQLPGSLDVFGFGIAACKWVLAKGNRNDLAHLGIKALIAISAGFIMIKLLWMTPNYWGSVYYVGFFRILTGLSAAALIIFLIALPNTTLGWFSGIIDYLGKISYGIYLWHLPIILSLKNLNINAGLIFLLATLACTVILASVTYHLIEKSWIQQGKSDLMCSKIGAILKSIKLN